MLSFSVREASWGPIRSKVYFAQLGVVITRRPVPFRFWFAIGCASDLSSLAEYEPVKGDFWPIVETHRNERGPRPH
jgi:hypothetical protein